MFWNRPVATTGLRFLLILNIHALGRHSQILLMDLTQLSDIIAAEKIDPDHSR